MEMAAALENPISSREFSQWLSHKLITNGKPRAKLAEAVMEMKSTIPVDTRVNSEGFSDEEQRHQVKSALDRKVALPSNNGFHSSPSPTERSSRLQHPVNKIMCTRSSNITDKTNTMQDNNTLNLEPFYLPKVCLSLSVSEKEADFLAINGSKLPLRPKKRLKSVYKIIQNISPGGWLSDISQEQYEVREKCIKKRPRGLKTMQRIESDSE